MGHIRNANDPSIPDPKYHIGDLVEYLDGSGRFKITAGPQWNGVLWTYSTDEPSIVGEPFIKPFKADRVSMRAALLQEAEKIITQDRNNSYGEPDQDFQRIAKLWSAICDREFSGHEVALMMICLKLSRLTWNVSHKDSWLDIAGYAACGFETAILQEKRREEQKSES